MSNTGFNVVVTNPYGDNSLSPITFKYIAPPQPPTVTGVDPATGSTQGGTTIAISGANFTGATGVTVGGNAATGTLSINGRDMAFSDEVIGVLLGDDGPE
jgi:hypothetical protein